MNEPYQDLVKEPEARWILTHEGVVKRSAKAPYVIIAMVVATAIMACLISAALSGVETIGFAVHLDIFHLILIASPLYGIALGLPFGKLDDDRLKALAHSETGFSFPIERSALRYTLIPTTLILSGVREEEGDKFVLTVRHWGSQIMWHKIDRYSSPLQIWNKAHLALGVR